MRYFNLLCLCICLLSSTTSVLCQYGQLNDLIIGPADEFSLFGTSISLDAGGRILAVGAPLFDDDRGLVQVYRDSSGNWVPRGPALAGVEQANGYGRAVALSADGSRLAVGAFNAGPGIGDPPPGGTPSGGQVLVYDWDGTNYELVGEPIAATGERDRFGTSVALSAAGDLVVAGGPGGGTAMIEAGNARVFNLVNGEWVQFGAELSGTTLGANLGEAVACSDDGQIIAVGAPIANSGGANNDLNLLGRVYVYERAASSLRVIGVLNGMNRSERFGQSIALNGDGEVMAVASPSRMLENSIGAVTVYERVDGNYVVKGTPITGTTRQEAFGASVDINTAGDRVVIGTFSADPGGFSSGRVDVFAFDEMAGDWVAVGEPITGDRDFAYFGWSVAMNGEGNRIAQGGTLFEMGTGVVGVYEDAANPVATRFVVSLDARVLSLPGRLRVELPVGVGGGDLSAALYAADGRLVGSWKRPVGAGQFELAHGQRPGVYYLRLGVGVAGSVIGVYCY